MNVHAPALYSDMGIEDLLPDSITQINPDNSINLVFDEKLFDFGLDSVLAVPDSTIKDSFVSIFNMYASPGLTVYTNTDDNELLINETELTQLNLRQGFVDYSVTSNVEDTILLTYTITTGTIAGAPIELNITMPPASVAAPVTVTGTYNLAGADLDLTGALHNTVNAYQTRLIVKTAPGTSGVSLASLTSKVSFRANFRDIIPSYVRGYFGKFTEQTSLEKQSFDFFKNFSEASIDLSQVTTSMYISNGLGADARITIDTLMATNTEKSTSVLLSHAAIGTAININRAIDLGWTVNPYVHTLDINSSNSNIESFLELIPNEIAYKLAVELNPLGNVSAHTDFLYEESRVEAGINVNIPLNLMASNIVLSDSIDFNLDEYDQNGKILRGKIKINLSNGLPLKAVVDVIMLDENNMSIGNLISGLTMNGNTGSTASSQGAATQETAIAELSDQSLEAAYRAKKLVIMVRFDTVPTSSFVSIYSTQRFKTQISVIADYLTQE